MATDPKRPRLIGLMPSPNTFCEGAIIPIAPVNADSPISPEPALRQLLAKWRNDPYMDPHTLFDCADELERVLDATWPTADAVNAKTLKA